MYAENNNFRGNLPGEFGNLEATEALWLSKCPMNELYFDSL